MGLFDLKARCAACEKDVGLNRYQIADKEWICPECFKASGLNLTSPIKTMKAYEIKSLIEQRNDELREIKAFNTTKRIGNFIEFDDEKQQFLVYNGIFAKKEKAKLYKYQDIVDFELLEDGETVTKGGLGRAITGGLLLGGVGAVVGGVTGRKKNKAVCNSLKIKITINDINNPTVYINFLTASIKKDSFIYKTIYTQAQECMSTLQLILNKLSENEAKENDDKQLSVADEILKFKGLLDSGIITDEEFNIKKKELLNL